MTRNWWRYLDWPLRALAYLLLQGYRYSLSLFMGRTCRHLPTCSEFTRDAILQHGFWPGGWMGLARLYRCRPTGTHGYDPVPDRVPEGARWFRPWTYGRWR